MNLEKRWATAGSNPRVWGQARTYKWVPYEALPPVGTLDGSFGWLEPSDRHGMGFWEGTSQKNVDAQVDARAREARKLGLTLPESFLTFMKNPALTSSLPSCTACYFDIGARLVPLPKHDGPERLLRFMNDQQACYLWYLVLEPGRRHRVAISWPRWIDDAEGDALEDLADIEEAYECATSFEEFVKRVWIENTLWFAVNGREALTGELLAYADAAAKHRESQEGEK